MLNHVAVPGEGKEKELLRCFDSSVTSASGAILCKKFSEIKLVLKKSNL